MTVRLPLNWCEDLPPEPGSAPADPESPGAFHPRHLERSLELVVRLVGEVLRHHPSLLADFNHGLRVIRRQCFPVPALK